eukprot:5359675-Prymnesium_polylepis.1
MRPGFAQCRLANIERTRQERACRSDLLVAHHASLGTLHPLARPIQQTHHRGHAPRVFAPVKGRLLVHHDGLCRAFRMDVIGLSALAASQDRMDRS